MQNHELASFIAKNFEKVTMMKKGKKKSLLKKYQIEIISVVMVIILLTDIEYNPENIFTKFWAHTDTIDKITIVVILILLVIIVHLLKDILIKWSEDYAVLVLIIEFTAIIPFLGHKILFFEKSTLKEADILSFYGTYLTFVGALSLGYFLYKREINKSCGKGLSEAAFLEEGIAEISKKLMNVDYYVKNGITLPTLPQWEMYYNSLVQHIPIGYHGTELYTELAHFFENVSKLNSAITNKSAKEASKIYEEFLHYEYYNCGAYNYVEAKCALNAISNGKYSLKTWIDDERNTICEFEEKYYETVELWIYDYMIKHNLDECKLIFFEKELVDALLTISEINKWIPCECEKRRIVFVVECISCDMATKSSILNYSKRIYSRKVNDRTQVPFRTRKLVP